jgi:NADPH2:quinone reductase
MRAAYYDETGPAATVFRLGDLPCIEPGPGEVLVRLHASGVNPTDTKVRGAAPGRAKAFARIIPHHDGAGTIEAVGSGVDTALQSRRVWVFCAQVERPFGTAAEYVTLPLNLTAPLPDSVTFEEGACLGVPAMTAWNAVLGDGPVAGKTVLITGGAGAVGNYAVQIARLSGARVFSTVSSPAKATEAMAAGAEATFDYRDADAARQILGQTDGLGVDHVVDVDIAANARLIAGVMAFGGRVASYGSSGLVAEVPVRDLRQRCVAIRFLNIHRLGPHIIAPTAQGIHAFLEIGALRHRIAARFALADIARAHETVEAGTLAGKVIVLPS